MWCTARTSWDLLQSAVTSQLSSSNKQQQQQQLKSSSSSSLPFTSFSSSRPQSRSSGQQHTRLSSIINSLPYTGLASSKGINSGKAVHECVHSAHKMRLKERIVIFMIVACCVLCTFFVFQLRISEEFDTSSRFR